MDEILNQGAIALLLPLTAVMLIVQTNPYHALVMRGIVGAVAALVYALFGAADVALTEALVGTMLSITLYAVAVRSSMNMKVGVLQNIWEQDGEVSPQPALNQLLTDLRQLLQPYHLRLEPIPYASPAALQAALAAKDIHTAILVLPPSSASPTSSMADLQPSQLHVQTRVPRLHTILQTGLSTVEIVDPQTSAEHEQHSHPITNAMES